jgi:hypothetical protein
VDARASHLTGGRVDAYVFHTGVPFARALPELGLFKKGQSR